MRHLRVQIVALALILALWQGLIWIFGFQKWILPQPHEVAEALWTYRALIAEHLARTAQVVGLGLAIGIAIGCATAVMLGFSRTARLYLRPILVLTQAFPVFALAPILVIWFGFGIEPKIAMAVLIIYFPVTSAFFDGLRATPPGYLDLAKTMGATPAHAMWRIRIPAAIPSLCSGLRLAAIYAPIGAFIGEWVGGGEGLGYLMTYANSRTKIDLLFAALVVFAAMTVALHAVTDRLCARLTDRFA